MCQKILQNNAWQSERGQPQQCQARIYLTLSTSPHQARPHPFKSTTQNPEIKEYFQQAADQGLVEIVKLNVGAIEINQAGIELTKVD